MKNIPAFISNVIFHREKLLTPYRATNKLKMSQQFVKRLKGNLILSLLRWEESYPPPPPGQLMNKITRRKRKCGVDLLVMDVCKYMSVTKIHAFSED